MSPFKVSLSGGVPEWLKGSDCKSDGSAFEGSNPSPSTIRICIASGNSSMVEHQPSKLRVASSSLVSRSIVSSCVGLVAHVAQLVERILGKDEVTGSIPVVGSKQAPLAI